MVDLPAPVIYTPLAKKAIVITSSNYQQGMFSPLP